MNFSVVEFVCYFYLVFGDCYVGILLGFVYGKCGIYCLCLFDVGVDFKWVGGIFVDFKISFVL